MNYGSFSTTYLYFLYRSPSSPSCAVFNAISSSIDKALARHPSANTFVFGDFNVHHTNWLTHSHGTDRPGEAVITLHYHKILLRLFPFQLAFLTVVAKNLHF